MRAIPQPLWQIRLIGPQDTVFDAAEALGFLEGMEALSLSVFEVKPGRFRLEAGYATESEAREVAARLGAEVERVEARDWVSEVQKNLAPVAAGRFVLFGAHDRGTVTGEVPIEVEAGPAFGSGHHPTTRGCLELFSDLLDEGLATRRVLDLGCGTGVLAIAAALTTEAEIVASDIDEDAVQVTEETAARNGARLNTFRADGMDDPRLQGPFDLVFANILAGPLIGLAPDVEKATAEGGLVILSGLLEEQAPDVLAAYQGLEEVRRTVIDGWAALLLRKA